MGLEAKGNMKKVALISAIAMVVLPGAANAETITFTGGLFATAPAGSTVETFDSLSPGTVLSSYSDSFATFTGTGIIEDPSTSVPTNPNSAEPYGDTSPYLSVQAGKTETITFKPSLTIDTFGFYWGSVDSYNTVVINFANNTSQSITPPSPANGQQASTETNGYWNITGTEAITSVVFGTGNTNAFETDNLYVFPTINGNNSTPTPLPAALPLFVSGLGALGLFGRRRKRDRTAFTAAV
jgi:hypothetical protein